MTVEITWYGHACFRLKDRNTTLITDPYESSIGFSLPRLKADIVTISHDAPHHNNVAGIKGDFRVLTGPGEYEIGGTFVTGIRLTPPKKSQDEKNGEPTPNNIFVTYLEDLAICHLGDLNHVPSQNQVEDLDSIDVLLVPVGGGQNALNAAQAAEVISLIEPYIVIPMHYHLPNITIDLDPVNKFLKEMGASKNEPESSLKLTSGSLPEETQIVLLEPKN